MTASRSSSWVGIIFILRAAVARANADDPAISVRSRSKNAALGPEPGDGDVLTHARQGTERVMNGVRQFRVRA